MKWFWNDAERRMRAPWRLLLHSLMLLLFVSVLTIVLALPAAILDGPDHDLVLTGDEAVVPVGILLAGTLGALAGSLLATWLAARHLDRRSFLDLGLRLTGGWWGDFGFGLLVGLLLVGASFALKLGLGWVEFTGLGIAQVGAARFFGELLAIAVACVAVGIYEELVIRGYQMTNLSEAFNIPSLGATGAILVALVVTSLFFALLHSLNPGPSLPLGLVNIALISTLVLGLSYALTGRLAIAIGLHTSWNFALSFVFGLPVSGVVLGSTSLLVTEDVGPELWTGGAFGLEGGLLGTIAIAAGLVALLVWVRLRSGRISLHIDLARPPDTHSGTEEAPSPEREQTETEDERQ